MMPAHSILSPQLSEQAAAVAAAAVTAAAAAAAENVWGVGALTPYAGERMGLRGPPLSYSACSVSCSCVQVGYSAILFYGYVGLVGLMLYACLRWWFKSKVSLAQVWCIYGRCAWVWLLTGHL